MRQALPAAKELTLQSVPLNAASRSCESRCGLPIGFSFSSSVFSAFSVTSFLPRTRMLSADVISLNFLSIWPVSKFGRYSFTYAAQRRETSKTGASWVEVPGSTGLPAVKLAHTPRLVVSHSTCPPLPSSPTRTDL